MSKKSNLALLLLATWGAASPGWATSVSSLDDLNWALAHAEACRQALLSDIETFRFAGAEGVAVVLRYVDTGAREKQVVLEKRGDRPATLRARILPEGLVGRMAKLHETSPDDAPETICGRIESKSLLITDGSVADQYLRELHNLTLSPLLSAPLPVHGNSYKIWVFHAAAHSYFEFLGLPESEDSIPPLQAWAERVLSLANPSPD